MNRRTVLGLLCLIGVIAAASLALVLKPALPAAERGRRLAELNGCFACHGAEAGKGAPNLGEKDPVPGFAGGVLMMDTPKGASQVRDWIVEGTEGMDARKAREDSLKRAGQGLPPEAHREEKPPALKMPSFRGRFNAAQISDLTVFALAQSQWGVDQASPAVKAGAEAAQKSGCFHCHGPLGLFARPNPGSLKGIVPAWQGKDAEDLVASHDEFRQWVREGRPDRFAKNKVAMYFLTHEPVRMPAFKEHLPDSVIDQLDSLYYWVRNGKPDWNQEAKAME